jgi:hypothetical protein
MHYILKKGVNGTTVCYTNHGEAMGFEKLPDNQGMIYTPDCRCVRRKKNCPDCFSCQWCSTERCRVCRGSRQGRAQVRKNMPKEQKITNY